MAATYTFTGQCYSQSGNVKKYEENQFTHSLNLLPSTCPFTYILTASYNPVNSYDFAYYNYSGGITNTTTGDYEYTFTAYAYTKWRVPNSFIPTYSYSAVINGIQQENNFAYYGLTGYSYSSMGSYTTQFQTNYGGVQKYSYLTLEIVAYWYIQKEAEIKTTYYTKKITFMYNTNVDQTFSLAGVYLFSIQSPGTFVGTESGWNSLGLTSLSTFFDQISSTDGTTGTAIGYVSCTGTSLNTAKLTVYTKSLTNATSTIARESMEVGTSTIYVIGIRKILDSGGSTKTYRYTTALLSTLTASSWSTTKPSVSGSSGLLPST